MSFPLTYVCHVPNHSQPYPTNQNVCRELWCVAGTWAKAAHPALEASACADQDRICSEGKCVSVG